MAQSYVLCTIMILMQAFVVVFLTCCVFLLALADGPSLFACTALSAIVSAPSRLLSSYPRSTLSTSSVILKRCVQSME